jgi:hypothetical protein
MVIFEKPNSELGGFFHIPIDYFIHTPAGDIGPTPAGDGRSAHAMFRALDRFSQNSLLFTEFTHMKEEQASTLLIYEHYPIAAKII